MHCNSTFHFTHEIGDTSTQSATIGPYAREYNLGLRYRLKLKAAGYRYVFNDIHSCGQCSGNYLMILQTIHQKSSSV